MINLNAYDSVEPNFYNATWVNPYYKRLYSKEIEYKYYYSLFKRYNTNNRRYDYYLFMTNKHRTDIVLYSTMLSKDKTIKINLSPIWNDTNLNNIKQESRINFEKVEEDEDGCLYYLDI